MNVAVLLSGNIRAFDKCKENCLKELEHLNPDYYVSTYDTQYNFRSYLAFGKEREVILSEQDIKNIFSDLNPKHIIIDKLSEMIDFFNREKEKFDSRIINTPHDKLESNHFLQFYKIKKALEMISRYETFLNKKYDVLIRTRMDLLIKNISSLDLENFDLKEKIIIGYEDISRIGGVRPEQHGWQDMFFISTFDNVRNVIDNLISEFYETTIQKSTWAYPHGIFESGIVKSNLKNVDMNILRHVERFDGSVMQIT